MVEELELKPTQKLEAGLADILRRTSGRDDKLELRVHPLGTSVHRGNEDTRLPCLDGRQGPPLG